MKKSKFIQPLVIYSLMIPCIMPWVFHGLSSLCGKTIGYSVSYAIYLALLLCGIILFRSRKETNSINKNKHKLIYYCVSYIPVIATFFAAFLSTASHLSLKLLFVLVPYAFFNGLLEEMFWRYTYNRKFGEDIIYAYVVPSILFTCWHFSLLCAKGVSYEGGPLALVGGACVMGLIWGLTMFKTKNVYVVASAHIIVNFFAFSQLLYENWFV